MSCRIKYFLIILLMLPSYCGVIMLIGSIYPDFQDMNAFSYVYKALLNYFQLKDGNSLVFCRIFYCCYFLFYHFVYSKVRTDSSFLQNGGHSKFA